MPADRFGFTPSPNKDGGLELTLRVPQGDQRTAVFGPAERNLKIIREALGVNIAARDDEVTVRGEQDSVEAARRVLDQLLGAGRRDRTLSRQQVLDAVAEAASEQIAGEGRVGSSGAARTIRESLDVYAGGRRISPRSPNQQRYIQAIFEDDLVFGIGPAGTGKTYLAVAAAVHHLKSGRVKRLVLCRPAVEAGE
ncbi:MAG: PhoH family protein, partial [Planctomycetota bacterium]